MRHPAVKMNVSQVVMLWGKGRGREACVCVCVWY